MTDKAHIAVVGTGWWATTVHIPALLANPRALPPVLVDKDPTRLKAAAEKYNLPHAYTSIEEAKAAHPDLHGAIIATTHAHHYEAASVSLNQGLHLLIEKPMTLLAAHAKALSDQADAAGLQILMGYTFPYMEPLKRAKRIIDDGMIGDVEYITCSMSSMTIEFLRGKPALYAPDGGYTVTGPSERTYADPAVSGGGQGVLQATHSVAMMFHLIESQDIRADRVSAFMNPLDTQVDVIDVMAVKMNSGALATVGTTGNIGKGDVGFVEVIVHGSKGRVMAEGFHGEYAMRLHDGREEHVGPTHEPYPGDVPSQKLIEIVLDGAQPLFPGKTNGLYTVELLEAGYRSAARDGVPVTVAELYA